jgi:hypothetical protein
MLNSSQNRSALFRDITEICDITNVMKPLDKKLDRLEQSQLGYATVGLSIVILGVMFAWALINIS